MRGRWLILFLLLVGSLGANWDERQTGREIRYGQTLSGEITAEQPCEYFWFLGTANDEITIDMMRTSGDLDGTLALYAHDDISSVPIATNDDRDSGGLDPLLALRLPDTARYTIAACRLQAETMRETTGTFDLTLTGQEQTGLYSTPTPTVQPLTEGLFGEAPTAIPEPPASSDDMISEDEANSAATDGAQRFTGTLDDTTPNLAFEIPAQQGQQLSFALHHTAGNFTTRLAVSSPGMGLLASASAGDGSELELTLQTMTGETLTAVVERTGSGSGSFELLVTGIVATGETFAPAPTPTVPTMLFGATETPAPTESAPCSSGSEAVAVPAESANLTNVYLAAGDSFYAENVTATERFSIDDDLNVVFSPRAESVPITVAALFCAPDGGSFDAGQSDYQDDTPSLLGLDWEWEGIPWETGTWYVEVSVDGVRELTLAFEVTEAARQQSLEVEDSPRAATSFMDRAKK